MIHCRPQCDGFALFSLHFRKFKATAFEIMLVTVVFFAFLQPVFSGISPFQDRCYEELDRCFSENGNFITDKCPYLNAVLLENFRFRPVADSLPHLCIQDTNIDGNYIKKGSRVIASLLAVMHNPEDFEEPERFKPDRFLVNGRLQAYLNI